MSFLKRFVNALMGSGSGSSDSGIYVYIRMRRSGEIVRLRLHPGNELSRDDDGRLFVRKLVMGQRSFEQAEAQLYFDDRYNVMDADISGGELSDEASYQAQQAEQQGSA